MLNIGSSKTRQIVGLDFLRFSAALFVLLYHFLYLTSSEGHTPFRLTHGIVSFPIAGSLSQFGWIGVEIFFLISGFVISLSASGRSARQFFESRFLRLVPTAFLCASITFFVALLVNDGDILSIIKRYIRSVFFIPFGEYIDGSYWTLCIEVMFYGLIWLILLFRKWSLFFYVICFLAVISFIYNIIAFYTPEIWFINSRVTDLLLLRHGCEFALGGLLYLYFVEGSGFKVFFPAVIAFVGSCYEISVQFLRHTHDAWDITGYITLMTIWMFSLGIFIYFVKNNLTIVSRLNSNTLSIIRQMGIMTYPLYLLHAVIGSALLYQLVLLGVHATVAMIIVVITTFILTYTVSKVEIFIHPFFKTSLSFTLNKILLKK